MNKLYQSILFIYHFSLGLVVPVLNLILLDCGATLQTLPLLYMVIAVTVLCFELPSGICADLLGRKKVFLISCILNFLSFFILIFVKQNLPLLILIIVLYGIGRAFSSGSIDALIIDQTLDRNGNEYLPKITSRLSIIEGTGLSLGSIAGGVLAQLSADRVYNLLGRSVLILAVMVLCQLFIGEDEVSKKEHKSLKYHVQQGAKAVLTNYKFAFVVAGGFFAGLFLSAIETYWQPAFVDITSNQNREWLLGMIPFFGFLAVTAGNLFSQRLMDKHKANQMGIYLISRGILAILLIVFALQKNSISFVAGYAGIYLMLGISNISESTIINLYTPNHMRASILSLFSFVTQIGLMCASLISSIAINRLHFSGVWIIMASLLGAYIIFGAIAEAGIRKKGRTTEA